jgi:hypothetical protein
MEINSAYKKLLSNDPREFILYLTPLVSIPETRIFLWLKAEESITAQYGIATILGTRNKDGDQTWKRVYPRRR